MTIREFRVPDLGEGLIEVTVVAWLVAPGADIVLNQPICVLETAKAEVEIPAPYAGRLVEAQGEPGETLKVGTRLARIAVVESDPPGASFPVSPDHTSTSHRSPGEPGPSARRPVLVGYGADPRADRSHRVPAVLRPNGKPLAKPPVRRLAWTLGVDLAALHPGSGPGGIVTRADVTTAASRSADVEVVPVRGVRARIASRLSVSRRNIPDAHCSVTVDCGRLLDVRTALRTAGTTVSPFTLILSALVGALREHPLLNATFFEAGPEIRVFRTINLGVGTATGRGLLVPVVRDAGRLAPVALADAVTDLTTRARSGGLRPDEMTGSTITVSNFGALGLDEGVPVINYPEAAVLGVGSIKARPAVVDDALAVRPTASLTVAFDHRVCDGEQAAGFLNEIRRRVENPRSWITPPVP